MFARPHIVRKIFQSMLQICAGPTLFVTYIGPCLCLTGLTLDYAGPALVAAQ